MKTAKEGGKKGTGKKSKSRPFFTDERIKFIFGVLLAGFALYLLLACVAYLFWWKTDLSLSDSQVISGADINVKNWSGKSGHYLAKMIIGFGFGYGAFFIPLIIGAIGLYLLNFPKINLLKLVAKFALAAIIISLILGFIFGKADGYLGGGPGGAQGYNITKWLNSFSGKIGTGIILTLLTAGYLVFALKFKPETFTKKIPSAVKSVIPGMKSVNDPYGPDEATENPDVRESEDEEAENSPEEKPDEEIEFTIKRTSQFDDVPPVLHRGSIIHELGKDNPKPAENTVSIEINKPEVRDLLPADEVERIMEDYDPRLDLSRYKFPPVSILKEHKADTSFDNNEVFENKENIIKTLGDHKIAIRQISATVGPTVTLYEIVPERGVRLARIKSLENDIALNLSALGIRIIAPIPGRGTVGIEVPNKKPEIVSMRSLIMSKAFQEAKFDLALALGRTITNDPFIVDLTKMPHLLVAGS
ncbi:MAG: DNA translocase FtsK 4TM domain-containing protein, partial [Bacteroidales bacterium]